MEWRRNAWHKHFEVKWFLTNKQKVLHLIVTICKLEENKFFFFKEEKEKTYICKWPKSVASGILEGRYEVAWKCIKMIGKGQNKDWNIMSLSSLDQQKVRL